MEFFVILGVTTKAFTVNSRLVEHTKDTDLLRRLYEDGYIDADGKPIDRGSEMR